jgi:hypothetical protein
MTKGELEVVWVPEPSLAAFGASSVGWWAIDVKGAKVGPHNSLDECVNAAISAGYSVPAWQRPTSN